MNKLFNLIYSQNYAINRSIQPQLILGRLAESRPGRPLAETNGYFYITHVYTSASGGPVSSLFDSTIIVNGA